MKKRIKRSVLTTMLVPVAFAYLIFMALPVWLIIGKYPLDYFLEFSERIVDEIK